MVPRFRQLLYQPGRGLGGPLWVDAPVFDLADDDDMRQMIEDLIVLDKDDRTGATRVVSGATPA